MLVYWAFSIGLRLICGTGFEQVPPAELPPLLTPPSGGTGPRPPGGPAGEYDHSHLYLPDYAPPGAKAPEACRPLGRWWVNPSLELAWLPSRTAPGAVRLRAPDGTGGTVPGPVVPLSGQAPDAFQSGLGLSVGRYFGDSLTSAIEGSFFSAGGGRTFDAYAPGMLVVFPQGVSNSAAQVLILPPPLDTSFVGVFPATLATWFAGGDVNLRYQLYCSQHARLDALAGYRFAYLSDELFLGTADAGSDDARRNRVAASNAFNGGQVGLAGEVRAARWYFTGAAKVALGRVRAATTATGMFVGAEGETAGGYARLAALSAPAQKDFAILPTVSVTAGRQVRERTRVFVGYSFQYLSRVTRLGDVLNPTTTGAEASEFWVSSLNFGLELRY